MMQPLRIISSLDLLEKDSSRPNIKEIHDNPTSLGLCGTYVTRECWPRCRWSRPTRSRALIRFCCFLALLCRIWMARIMDTKYVLWLGYLACEMVDGYVVMIFLNVGNDEWLVFSPQKPRPVIPLAAEFNWCPDHGANGNACPWLSCIWVLHTRELMMPYPYVFACLRVAVPHWKKSREGNPIVSSPDNSRYLCECIKSPSVLFWIARFLISHTVNDIWHRCCIHH